MAPMEGAPLSRAQLATAGRNPPSHPPPVGWWGIWFADDDAAHPGGGARIVGAQTRAPTTVKPAQGNESALRLPSRPGNSSVDFVVAVVAVVVVVAREAPPPPAGCGAL